MKRCKCLYQWLLLVYLRFPPQLQPFRMTVTKPHILERQTENIFCFSFTYYDVTLHDSDCMCISYIIYHSTATLLYIKYEFQWYCVPSVVWKWRLHTSNNWTCLRLFGLYKNRYRIFYFSLFADFTKLSTLTHSLVIYGANMVELIRDGLDEIAMSYRWKL